MTGVSADSSARLYEGPRDLRAGECWMRAPTDDELYRTDRWRVILNWNQDRLGKVMLALLRHEERVTDLGDGEVLELWDSCGT